MDNADLKDLNHKTGKRSPVVVVSERCAGDATLTVTSPDLAAARLNIKTYGKLSVLQICLGSNVDFMLVNDYL